MFSRATALGFSLLLSVASHGIAQDGWWTHREAALDSLLSELVACAGSRDDPTGCDRFIPQALREAYCVDDFDGALKASAIPLANQIASWVDEAEEWEPIGTADDPSALVKAQAAANSRVATLAIMTDEPDGHIALILPGRLRPSGSWGRTVPNSASFFAHRPDRSYIGKPLSYAFRSPEGVKLYLRSYEPCLPFHPGPR